MVTLAAVVSWVLVLAAVYQAVLAAVFVYALTRAESPKGKEEEERPLPKTSILLSLRGADPGLLENLKRLMQQDHPHFDLHIVVDRTEDPAWAVVEQAMRLTKAANVHLHSLCSRLSTCSLKCSALVQAIGELDNDCEVIALADADVQVHPRWLRELVTPLGDERVGATFGNRWFLPHKGQGGSLVRYLWNAGAVVPMYFLSIPWAGTFAIRTSVLRRSGLVEQWSRAIVDDGPVRRVLQSLGLQVRFVPSLMMINREECSWSFSLNFVTRQLLWTRIYHPHWPFVLLHAVASAGLLLLAVLLVVYGIVAARWEIAVWAGSGLLGSQLVMLTLLQGLDWGVGRAVEPRGEHWLRWSLSRCLRLIVLLPVTQCLHFAAALTAQFKRHVVWRGVTYRIGGPWDIRLLEDRPFPDQSFAGDSSASL